MVNPDRNFVGRKGLIFYPKLCLLDCLVQAWEYQLPVHAVFVRFAIRPFPNIAKHPAMKIASERLADRVALAQRAPAVGFKDVLLFQFVQFAMQRYVRGDESFTFFRRERRRARAE